MKQIEYLTMNFGCDPEFFFAKKTLKGRVGRIIGAEKIIPKEGVQVGNNTGAIIVDGVQAELNPKPSACRQNHAKLIHHALLRVSQLMKSNRRKRITINWKPTVRVTPSELRSLSPEYRILGCSPSLNAYDEHIEMPDPTTYPYRSAGGHIHIGFVYKDGKDPVRDLLKGDLKTVVKVLDIIVGNTCILIDRDEGNIERRKAYGRAGEYRKPPHGLEYRVLSNFWLKDYKLMSFVFGLMRLGIGFANSKEAVTKLFKAVKEEDIRNAINNNDFGLAKANFEKIKPLIIEGAHPQHSLNNIRIPLFEKFIETGGVKRWFRKNPLKHWASGRVGGSDRGWERFLDEELTYESRKISK